MTRPPKPRSPRWWNREEQRLRNFIDDPGIEGLTFAEIYHGIGSNNHGCCTPKAELAALCRLLGLEPAGLPA